MRWFRSPTAAALELESSAPPMDLDRPQGSSAQPLDLPQRSSTPFFPMPDTATPLSLAELAQLSEVSTTPDAHDLGTASESAMASNAESALNVGQADGTESANAESAAEAELAVAAESALKSGSAKDTSALMKPPASVDKPVQHTTHDEQPRVVLSSLDNPTQAVGGDASGVTAVRPTEHFSSLDNPTQAVGGEASGVTAVRPTVLSSRATDVQGERQLLVADGGGKRQVLGGDGGGERQVVPSTEEDLDSAMQELAQEVRYVPSNTEYTVMISEQVYSKTAHSVSPVAHNVVKAVCTALRSSKYKAEQQMATRKKKDIVCWAAIHTS